MNIESVVDFSTASTHGKPERLFPELVLKGIPEQRLHNYYCSPCGQLNAGLWESAVGQWDVNFTEDEYCELVQGVVVLRDLKGKAKTFLAGDRFVIPAGFQGTWEVIEPCQKFYVAFDKRAVYRCQPSWTALPGGMGRLE